MKTSTGKTSNKTARVQKLSATFYVDPTLQQQEQFLHVQQGTHLLLTMPASQGRLPS